MTQDPLLKALAASDERRRADRAARIKWWSATKRPTPAAFIDRVEVSALLSEAECCYFDGRFVATILCAAAYAEQALVGELLDLSITDNASLGVRPALRIALAQQILDSDLVRRMGELADLRNSYAHLKAPDDSASFSGRYMAARMHPDLVRERDARTALGVMSDVFLALLRPGTDEDLAGAPE